MKTYYFTFVLLVTVSLSSFSQEWKTMLLKDLVKIENGKFTSTDCSLITMSDGTKMQIKSHAEAPAAGVISRDQFISIFATTTMVLVQSILTQGGLLEADYSIKTVEELIGVPDVEINCIMGKTGIQIEVKSDDGTNRVTQTWDEIF